MCRTKVNSPGEKRKNFFQRGKNGRTVSVPAAAQRRRMLIISNGRHSEPSLPPTPLCGGGGGEAGVRSKGQGSHTGRPLRRGLSAALASAKKGKCFPRTYDGAAGLLRQAGPRSVLRFAKCRRTVYARFHCGKPSKAGEGGALGIDFSCPLWYNNKYSGTKRDVSRPSPASIGRGNTRF